MARPSSKFSRVSALGVPLRQRTEKACDHCRRRKTKCDGEPTCSACVDTGLRCTYGHRLKQHRGTGYVAYLEQRVKELESILDSGTATTTSLSKTEHSEPDFSYSSREIKAHPQSQEEDITSPTSKWSTDSSPCTESKFPSATSAESEKGEEAFNAAESFRQRDSANDAAARASALIRMLGQMTNRAQSTAQHLALMNRNFYQAHAIQPESPFHPNQIQQSSPDFTLFSSPKAFDMPMLHDTDDTTNPLLGANLY